MEYCENSLNSKYNELRKAARTISETELKDILRQALIGMNCMHENKMVHLDIKPDNLLFKDKTLKIADLGLCRVTRIKKWS